MQALDRAGLPGERLPWRDVLHEGPVPGGADARGLREIRARFLADAGWEEFERVRADLERRDAVLDAAGRHDELVLWFEHDLYDQLQLIQVLDRLADGECPARITLICDREYLGSSAPDRLRARFEGRRPLAADALALGRTAWAAFTSPEPTPITVIAANGTRALPFLGGAFRRALEEYPSRRDGLSRSERQLLSALAAEPRTPAQAFRAAHHDVEDPVFLGDAVFATYVARLGGAADPALEAVDGGPVQTTLSIETSGPFWHRAFRLTGFGRALLEGRADWVATNGIDRWIGGVHLGGHSVPWRWDEGKRVLVG